MAPAVPGAAGVDGVDSRAAQPPHPRSLPVTRPPPLPVPGIAAAAALLLAACGSEPRERPRLVVLFAPCTVGKHSLSPYHQELRFTPNLDAFARESLVFERHLTEAEQSGPAYAALFTGTHAHRHGAYDHPVKLSDDLYLLAEAFADGGYETWFWSGHPMASARLNYGQGVASERTVVTQVSQRGVVSAQEAHALTGNAEEFDRLLGRLATDPELEVFVQLNFTLSHGPYSYYSTAEELSEFCRQHPERTGGL